MEAHFLQGKTWDGGPPASIPLLPFDESRPILTTLAGEKKRPDKPTD
jgi:hypothetical protein